MQRIVAFLLSPGNTTGVTALVARLMLAIAFIPAGIGKFTNHDAYITRFDRWGFPQPSAMAYIVGILEVLGGLALLAGFLPRLVALVLAGNMAGAFLTAGFVDGGANLVVPPILAAICLVVVYLGQGRYGWSPRLRAAMGT